MMIVHVDFDVDPAERTHALAVLEMEVGEVRALPGCRHFAPYADPALPGRVSIVHEWEDEAALATYLASTAFARSGEALRPIMTGPPSSRRFRAEMIEEVA
ncbi:putative quinol monooxygenase [Maritimibacter sp. UBA3975]|uniref:putative quinol monooxygenase n=1 Tax=Maritimibacter sp. UBA3975 TaxID=1946833 RepID=UPI000C0B30E6|nr:putative quinol monooxygenase [Maritimibacter sp. UBA3975]MAM62623.1 antibiotic biosynthesis monooxygenase [Maritimibacter sp.]|tara:strand:+ start:6171 stop:6473 length:303 start_codon:yes stop_codon:yes gene_type:complete